MEVVQDGSTSLPLELILRIVECLAPATAVALPPHDITNQTIRACMLVSKAIYCIAIRLLYKHCLYIDTSDRLRRLLISLNHHLTPTTPPSQTTEVDSTTIETTNITSTTSTIPKIDLHPHLQNLYIAPFPSHTIDDLPTAQWVFELLSTTRHTLRRLVSSIPLDTLPSWKDHLDVRVWLRRAFEQLTHVEEFVCLCDDLDLTLYEEAWASEPLPWSMNTQLQQQQHQGASARIPVWAKWTSLRRLSIREHDLLSSGYTYLRRFPRLEGLVVVPRGHMDHELFRWLMDRVVDQREHDVQVIWPDIVRRSESDRFSGIYTQHLERLAWARLWNVDRGCGGGQMGGKVTMRAVDVDPDYAPDEEEQGFLRLQTWMTDRAVDGCLWNIGASARFRPSALDPALWIDASLDDDRWAPEWMEGVLFLNEL